MLFKLDLGIGTTPKSPRTVPAAAGMSLILNIFGVLITLPLLNLAVTFILTSFPFPGFKTYFPSPLSINLLPAETLGFTLLLPTPGTEIDTGLSNPRYTTFILSADTIASFGSAMTE